jgi:hypothetical protein
MPTLEQLLEGIDRKKLAAFLKDYKPQPVRKHRDSSRANGPVKVYTTVIKQYTCLVCGSTFSRRYDLHKGESTETVSPEGTVVVVVATGKEGEVVLPCTISKCEHCIEAVRSWPRQVLEDNFMRLLDACTFKEKVVYNKRGKEET